MLLNYTLVDFINFNQTIEKASLFLLVFNPKETMGGGIKTRPIRRLPLARQKKFELKSPYEFFFFYV